MSGPAGCVTLRWERQPAAFGRGQPAYLFTQLIYLFHTLREKNRTKRQTFSSLEGAAEWWQMHVCVSFVMCGFQCVFACVCETMSFIECVSMCVHMHMYVCVCASVYVCVRCISVCVCIFVCVCICVCMCVCVGVCV